MSRMDYEAVIGIEVHVELKTASKIFCSCSTAFGSPPNTQCCPVCMGLPGAMPSLNRRAVELAVRASVALDAEVLTACRMDRKNYFYPDLPKAYQISQADAPISRNGCLGFFVEDEWKRVRIERLHIEEDAGKLLHEGGQTRVDLNRCGVPLIEIVSAPDMHTAKEASSYLRALRDVLVACDVSDCKMQEGAFRCDVNLSLRKKGEKALGVRTETKNINSFSFVEKAIEYEIARQAEILDAGGVIGRETRRFDPSSGETRLMRVKECEADYRFFPEPDLLPFALDADTVDAIRRALPELPTARAARFAEQYGLLTKDISVLCSDRALAAYFEEAASKTRYVKLLSNLIQTELLRVKGEGDGFSTPVAAHRLAAVCELLGDGEINSAIAKKLIVRLLAEDLDPVDVVKREDLAQIRDPERLRAQITEVLATQSRAVADYLGGKQAAMRALQGRAMALTSGRADPVLLEKLLLEMLENLRKDGE